MAGPEQGDPAPDFSLPDVRGELTSLHPCLLEGAVLLEFLRGTWDPGSRRRIASLVAAGDAFQRRGTRLLLVSCERQDGARRYVESESLPYTLLVDATHEVSKVYGVFRTFSYGAFHVAQPGTFLIDRCGYVRYTFRGRRPIDAAPLDNVGAALAAVVDEAKGRE